MIKSMTGFSSVSQEDDRASIGVTVRSVNHRYLDLQMRLPQLLAQLEGRMRGCVQARAARGRVEVAVSVQMRQEPVLKIAINEAFTSALAGALDKARQAGLVQGSLVPGDLLRFPQALTVREEAPELDDEGRAALEAAVVLAVERALDDLDAMRATEGAMLRADLDARKAGVIAAVEDVAARAAAGEADLRERLARRVGDLAADLATDPVAVAQEVVRFAARSDISEEVVRFRAHVQQWTSLTEGPEPCGRKLDFLLQEMNREVNTIGSKADGTGIPETIIGIKAELEKMREQVQNVE
ncbi:MAG: YicC/YloC family endoribonuclease [Vicinamibacterales bacterium]